MTEKIENIICTKFCQKLGNINTETSTKLQKVFEEDYMSQTWLYKWFKCFWDGWENIDGGLHFGRSAASRMDENIADVHTAIWKVDEITMHELLEDVNISHASVKSSQFSLMIWV